MRIMRQSVEMWEGGIDYLAGEMGLNWLATGVDFHITLDYIDLLGDSGGEFTTYPIVDPEIVVIASNPVGGVGIGIDPLNFVVDSSRRERACPATASGTRSTSSTGTNLPGFNSHHERGPGPTSRTAAAPAATSASRSTAQSTRYPGRSTSSTSSTSSATSSGTA